MNVTSLKHHLEENRPAEDKQAYRSKLTNARLKILLVRRNDHFIEYFLLQKRINFTTISRLIYSQAHNPCQNTFVNTSDERLPQPTLL